MKAKLLQRMATSVPGTFDWRSATVEVYGKSRLMSEVHGGKLYHGSGEPVVSAILCKRRSLVMARWSGRVRFACYPMPG